MVEFSDLSTLMGYLMPHPVYIYIYILIGAVEYTNCFSAEA